jgi:anti-sigma B factor antagonist
MPLTIHIQPAKSPDDRSPVLIQLGGSLDSATAPELEQQIKPLLDGNVQEMVFNLRRLQFISSAGLRVFAAARKRLRERGGQASFVEMQPQIHKVFEIVRALPGIGVFQDDKELDAYLASRQQRAPAT